MTAIPCFTTPIWCIKPNNHQLISKELLDYVRDELLANKVGAMDNSSAVGGYQSQKFDIQAHPLFSKALTDAIGEVAADLKIRPECKTVITDCWANVNSPGSFNKQHIHANSMLSGVYYPSVPENSGAIVFTDPRLQAHILTLPVTQKSTFSSKRIRRVPQEGEFIMFPSWLEHSVDMNESGEERVSVAFNVVFD